MATGEQSALPDFQSVFQALTGQYLILAPDAPAYTIVAVNDAYLRVTMRTREQVVGTPVFDAFPDNPGDPQVTGVEKVRASLDTVLRTGQPHALEALRYDIARPAAEGGGYEERYWNPVNTPVLGDDGRVRYIVHRAVDVTAEVRGRAALRGSGTGQSSRRWSRA